MKEKFQLWKLCNKLIIIIKNKKLFLFLYSKKLIIKILFEYFYKYFFHKLNL